MRNHHLLFRKKNERWHMIQSYKTEASAMQAAFDLSKNDPRYEDGIFKIRGECVSIYGTGERWANFPWKL